MSSFIITEREAKRIEKFFVILMDRCIMIFLDLYGRELELWELRGCPLSDFFCELFFADLFSDLSFRFTLFRSSLLSLLSCDS